MAVSRITAAQIATAGLVFFLSAQAIHWPIVLPPGGAAGWWQVAWMARIGYYFGFPVVVVVLLSPLKGLAQVLLVWASLLAWTGAVHAIVGAACAAGCRLPAVRHQGEGTMPAHRNVILPAILVLSALANIGLGFFLHVQSQEDALIREEAAERRHERDALLALIPQLKPRITKGELLQVLRRLHPGEQVNDVGDHVQWRLIQFWFDHDGALEAVRWSS